jgi:hypothetical protein
MRNPGMPAEQLLRGKHEYRLVQRLTTSCNLLAKGITLQAQSVQPDEAAFFK